MDEWQRIHQGMLRKKLKKQGELERSQAILNWGRRFRNHPNRLSGNGSTAIALKNGACNVAEKADEYAIMECKHSCFSSMASFSGLDKIYDQPMQNEKGAKITDDGLNGGGYFSIVLP
ncbi:hypothetical protein [Nitrosomonas sp.]|uniref:hypothetical protein n=1 Tax=Nitrosomonas sp. TaxID=42353 RepID=UPI002084D44D|nr:hypothetical protein [Nitrosomonas sp.]GJL76661.1 MAG: hypothetical protein NMNS02_27670 [Nitrosomonas sp.]